MERKKELSGAAKRKQRQEREESKNKLPKLDSFFTKPLSATVPSTAETSVKSVKCSFLDSRLDAAVLTNKVIRLDQDPITTNTTINAPAENDYLDASVQPTVEETSISTSPKVLEISNDLGNYMNKKLIDNEKRLIFDKGPLKLPGPFPKDPHQDNRSFSETYYVSTSQYGPVDLGFGQRSNVVQVLRRLFDIIITLAKSSLALRGHREDLSEGGNHGNFLSIVQLVARYDHILRQVLDMPKGSTRYLSATIQNEMIECLGTKLENHLLDRIRASPFFTINMDTTQDVSKVDQLSIVVRYAVVSRSENGQPIDIEVKEVFLGFHAVSKHSAADLVNQNLRKGS
ncbi:uncharacterized protein LOC113505496 [Trichoplusia ni]|uniref:Uncharacterized protein LOC113505496 n=1 Tax=Trichoplusia ni TaxID=7111 RepID=A0A7E5WV49_TRINI|nr:uncharacterized protein LOC113505496 [Trichoplusia ni]